MTAILYHSRNIVLENCTKKASLAAGLFVFTMRTVALRTCGTIPRGNRSACTSKRMACFKTALALATEFLDCLVQRQCEKTRLPGSVDAQRLLDHQLPYRQLAG